MGVVRIQSIKSKIIILTVSFTLFTTILMASVSFIISQFFLEKNIIQSTEFNLKMMMDGISSDIDELIHLSNWSRSNGQISNYLQSTEENTGPLAISTYERLKEEYQHSKIRDYYKRIVISNNDGRHLQIIGDTFDFYSIDIKNIENLDFFDPLLNADYIKWIGVIEDPLVISSTEQVIPVVRPIYASNEDLQIGWSYITVSSRIITDHLKNYNIQNDSELFITIDDLTYRVDGTTLTKTDKLEKVKELNKDVTIYTGSSTSVITLDEKTQRTLVSYPSNLGWSLSQTISEQEFNMQRQWYYKLLILICLLIIILGSVLTIYLNKMINVPIKKLQRKMRNISQGDFSKDGTIEWKNEFGEIGKGINNLSSDIIQLMDKRLSDEKQKNELEYQILLSQINPHFLYNTLNSIKWMATIQNATGIAEMTTCLSRVLKKVSKETNQIISIRDELSILDDYFLIQQYRYGGIIKIHYDIEREELYNCKIIKFSLQPLVENAIFHGIEPKGEAGTISVSIKHYKESDLIIEITDDGIGMTQEQIRKTLSGEMIGTNSFFKKIGISNVNQRIKYTYGNKYGLTMISELGKFNTMRIIIPKR